MDYISAKEAAERWNVHVSRVGVLARSGRIPGAQMIGKTWMIPADAAKPSDGRKSSAKTESVPFRFPFFYNCKNEQFDPPLSAEEQQLRQVQRLFFACRFEQSLEQLGTLPETAENRYVRICALFFATVLRIYCLDHEKLMHYYRCLNLALEEDFPYCREMRFLLYEFDALVGDAKYFSHDFSIEPGYYYQPSAMQHITMLTGYSLCMKLLHNPQKLDLSLYELSCSTLENSRHYMELSGMHTCLCSVYVLQSKSELARLHLRKALEIAQEHELYWFPATFYSFFSELFDQILRDFPIEFAKKMAQFGREIERRYQAFAKIESVENFYTLISRKDYPYVYYAMQDFSAEKIAELTKLSVATVNSRYHALYKKVGVKSRKELKAAFSATLNGDALRTAPFVNAEKDGGDPL